jgi:hypothetical protein
MDPAELLQLFAGSTEHAQHLALDRGPQKQTSKPQLTFREKRANPRLSPKTGLCPSEKEFPQLPAE